MIQTNAIFSRKIDTFNTTDCIIEKTIRLSSTEYDKFKDNMLQDQDFIKDNVDLMYDDHDGKVHCLLVVGDGRSDGILIDSSGSNYARHSAFIPNAEGLLTVGQYPALAELNLKLTNIVEFIVDQSVEHTVVNLDDLETKFGIDLMSNGSLRNTILAMLDERTEIQSWELDKNELIIFGDSKSKELTVEKLSDSSISKMDMYACGYSNDAMIPLNQIRALELFDKGHEVFRLYRNDFELVANSRHDIEVFDGIFGVADPTWSKETDSKSIEAFILNREYFEGDNILGEWLTLPSDAETLCGLFERIDIDKPSEGAFMITAVRVPYDYMREHITKYDSLDELNMLASCINEEKFHTDQLQSILTSNNIPSGAASLINLLDADNDEYKIVGEALRSLRTKTQELDNSDKKQSVVEQIKAARKVPKAPMKSKIKPDKNANKDKEER